MRGRKGGRSVTEEGHCRARRGNGFRHWFSVNDQELYGIARRAYAGHLCREPVDFGKASAAVWC